MNKALRKTLIILTAVAAVGLGVYFLIQTVIAMHS